MGNSSNKIVSSEGGDTNEDTSTSMIARRDRIFVKPRVSGNSITLDMSALYNDEKDAMTPESRNLIVSSFGKLFFLEKEHPSSLRTALLLQSMERESAKRGTAIMTQGDEGSKLYIVEEGEVEVSINGAFVRRMGRGALIGELSLLFDCPRSATVRCLSNCVFWVLDRNRFKKIQNIAASASLAQTAKWLGTSDMLKALGSVSLSVLSGNLTPVTFYSRDKLLSTTWRNNQIILIQSGSAVINLHPDLECLTSDQRDAVLGIIRPSGKRRQSFTELRSDQLMSYLSNLETRAASADALLDAMERIDSSSTLSDSGVECVVHEGCIIGLGILFAKAGLAMPGVSDEYLFRWEAEPPGLSTSAPSGRGSPLFAATEAARRSSVPRSPARGAVIGTESPLVRARTSSSGLMGSSESLKEPTEPLPSPGRGSPRAFASEPPCRDGSPRSPARGAVIGSESPLARARTSSDGMMDSSESLRDSRTGARVSEKPGAYSPYDCIVESDSLSAFVFNVETFENLFGRVEDVLPSLLEKAQSDQRKTNASIEINSADLKQPAHHLRRRRSVMAPAESDFQHLRLLGKGSTSVVLLSEYNGTAVDEPTETYALKVMSKTKIIESGRLRHAFDECKLLSKLSCSFVVSFFGVYETKNCIVLAMEPVLGCDIWELLYDSRMRSPFFMRGLPMDLTRFYAASVVLALDHIHGAGIAYRDLNPENIRLDESGHVRLIDFGNAKQIPFMSTDKDGRVRINVKSFTICGTPGEDESINTCSLFNYRIVFSMFRIFSSRMYFQYWSQSCRLFYYTLLLI
jgi:CRP-like cAMP-binding protein